MSNRFSFMTKVLICFFVGGFGSLTSACDANAVGASPQTFYARCSMPLLNPYNIKNDLNPHRIPNSVTNIFERYKNGSMIYESARQESFSLLGKNVKLWSHYRDVQIGEQGMARVTFTYLDPMLIQYVVLNHALTPPNNTMDTNWFNMQVQNAMDNMAKREEIVFIITIAASPASTDPLEITFPITKLALSNASGKKFPPSHYDPALDKKADVLKRPIFGYVWFPVAVSIEGTCTEVVDQWTTMLTLDLENFDDKNDPFYKLSWSIPYQPLVLIDAVTQPAPTLDPNSDFSRFTTTALPPTPNAQNDDGNSQRYWEEMGRYIWNTVILESDR